MEPEAPSEKPEPESRDDEDGEDGKDGAEASKRRTSRWSVLAIIAAVAFVTLLALGIVLKDGPSIQIGDDAPDAATPTLGGSKDVSLSDYRGQWVLLNFWASWCDPCRAEAPAIEKFSKENKGNVVVIGMDSKENSVDAGDFADEYGLSYTLLHDGAGDLMGDYNVKGLPESFLIDPDGKIAYIYRGPVDEKILEENFKPLIDESA